MNRVRRSLVVIALSGAALAGAAASKAADASAEQTARAGLEACSIVQEAATLGVNARLVVPDTYRACRLFVQSQVPAPTVAPAHRRR